MREQSPIHFLTAKQVSVVQILDLHSWPNHCRTRHAGFNGINPSVHKPLLLSTLMSHEGATLITLLSVQSCFSIKKHIFEHEDFKIRTMYDRE